MKFEKNVVTKKGKQLIAKSQGGLCNIIFTKAAVGNGSYIEEEIKELESVENLRSQVQEYLFEDKPAVEGESKVLLKAVVGNRDVHTGFFIKEFGIFAIDPDEGEILYAFAVSDSNKADWLPEYNGNGEQNIRINSILAVGNSEHVEISNDSLDYVTFDTLLRHTSDNDNPHEVDAEQVGLGQVDNTADVNKPVSILQQRKLDEYYEQLTGYTDKEIADLIGGAPETLDTIKEVADAIAENSTVVDALNAAIGTKANKTELDSHTSNKNNPHTVTKAQVGLGNADNTADSVKRVSYAAAAGSAANDSSGWNTHDVLVNLDTANKAGAAELASHKTSADHDGRYYTEAETNSLLAKKTNQTDFNNYTDLMEKIINTKASVTAIKDLSDSINLLSQNMPKSVTAEITAQYGNVYIPSCSKVLSVQNSNAAISADCILGFVLQNATTLYYTKNAANRTQITIVYI